MKKKMNNNKYWFILGRETKLSIAEIGAFLNCPLLKYNGETILKIKNENITPEIIDKLGGTIKIGKELGENFSLEELKNKIIDDLKDNSAINGGKVVFGLSFFNRIDKKIGIEIKKELKNLGKSVRYVVGKEKTLNAAQIIGNKIIAKGGDFLVEEINNKYNLAKTIVVQNINEWSKRDFDRPASDSFSGMLPPKLAMMLINLSGVKKENVLLDPFCGSGTILAEAIYLGYKNLIGSDLSPKAIEDTKENIEWINTEYRIQNIECKLYNEDVKNLSKILKPKSVDTIITEPYLGKPLKGSELKNFLLKQTEELKNLYEKTFEEFKEILKPNGIVVFVIPKFKHQAGWITIDILPKLKELGFKVVPMLVGENNLVYCRPDQKVGREIWKFILKNNK